MKIFYFVLTLLAGKSGGQFFNEPAQPKHDIQDQQAVEFHQIVDDTE